MSRPALHGAVDIESIRHKALARFFTTGKARGLDGALIDLAGAIVDLDLEDYH